MIIELQLTYIAADAQLVRQLCAAAGQDPVTVDKVYIVRTDGVEVPLAMSVMQRKIASLTKGGLKAWVHTVARQQSRGKRGLPGVWLVQQELLDRYGVDNNLPADILAQAQMSEQRREKRNKVSVGSGPAAQAAAAVATGGSPADDGPGSNSGGGGRGRQGSAMAARAALAKVPLHSGSAAAASAGAPARSVGSQPSPANAQLTELAAAGVPDQQLEAAALHIRLGAAPAMVTREWAHSLPIAAAALSYEAASEGIDAARARVSATGNALLQALFLAVQQTGPAGAHVASLAQSTAVTSLEPVPGIANSGGSGSVAQALQAMGLVGADAVHVVAQALMSDTAYVPLGAGAFALRAIPGALDAGQQAIAVRFLALQLAAC